MEADQYSLLKSDEVFGLTLHRPRAKRLEDSDSCDKRGRKTQILIKDRVRVLSDRSQSLCPHNLSRQSASCASPVRLRGDFYSNSDLIEGDDGHIPYEKPITALVTSCTCRSVQTIDNVSRMFMMAELDELCTKESRELNLSKYAPNKPDN